MSKFTIVETRPVHSLNPANASGFDTLVTYTDEAQRIHTITVDGPSPTPADIDQAVRDQHADRTQHKGRVVEG